MLTFFRVFVTPAMLAGGYTGVLGPEESFHFRTSHDSHDYLLPPTTTYCQSIVPHCACLEKGLRHLALDCLYGVVTA